MTGRLEIDADLDLVVEDGRGGRAAGSVTADGGTVRMRVDRPEVLLGALPGRRDTTDALAAVRGLGVRVEVHGPSRLLAVLDPARPSRLAGLLTGDPALRPTAGAARAWLAGPGRRPVVAVAAGVTTGLAVVLAAAVVAARRQERRGQDRA